MHKSNKIYYSILNKHPYLFYYINGEVFKVLHIIYLYIVYFLQCFTSYLGGFVAGNQCLGTCQPVQTAD